MSGRSPWPGLTWSLDSCRGEIVLGSICYYLKKKKKWWLGGGGGVGGRGSMLN